jgi:predicted HicB family RNase H-like nuclease
MRWVIVTDCNRTDRVPIRAAARLGLTQRPAVWQQSSCTRKAFRDSVDDYLEYCEQRGETPDRPFTGRLMLRMPPELHRTVYARARQEGKSLNQFIADRLA